MSASPKKIQKRLHDFAKNKTLVEIELGKLDADRSLIRGRNGSTKVQGHIHKSEFVDGNKHVTQFSFTEEKSGQSVWVDRAEDAAKFREVHRGGTRRKRRTNRRTSRRR